MEYDKSDHTAITQVDVDDGERGGGEGDRLMGSYQLASGSAPYATIEHLKRYIPSLSPDYNTGQTTREWIGQYISFLKPREDGKRRGDPMSKRAEMLRNQALIAIFVGALNVGIFAWAIISYPPDNHGVGTFYTGRCPTASAVNSAAHVVLNVLSTAFLGAGNYCMQIMVAPSREEMKKAHAKGRALEIGVPSLKNLLCISRKRVACWITLGIFATTLHVFWNSAIFTSLPTVFIPRAVVTNDFLNATDNWAIDNRVTQLERKGGRFWKQHPDNPDVDVNSTVIYGMQTPAKETYTRLNTSECIRNFVEPMGATRALVVVAKNMTSEQNGGSSLIDAAVFGWNADSSWASSWICLAYQPEAWQFCTWEWAERQFANNWELMEPPIQVDSCLVGEAGDNSERCGLHYSTHVMGIVCGCTLIEFILIIGIWVQQRRLARGDDPNKRTMTTLGDAIHSYLEDTGHETYEKSPKPGMWGIKLVEWQPRADGISWFKAVTLGAWTRAMTLFIVAMAVFSFFIGSSASAARDIGIDLSPAVLWNHGFGVHPALTAGSLGPLNDMGLSSTALMLWHILITNAAQVIISLLYIFYNSIFTRQLVADEWVRFLGEDGKKVLRVSAPRGMQRSTYFLSLPAKYSVPLMAMSTAMHWLISQSIYLVQTRAYGPGLNSERIPSFDNTGRGYSVLGSVLAILFGGLVVAIMLINSGVRRYRGIPDGFQLMAYNSSGIQAMCQRPEGDREAGFFPIRMGVTTGAGEGALSKATPRLAFSTDINLTAPEPGKKYYQPVLKQRNRWWAWRSRRNVVEED